MSDSFYGLYSTTGFDLLAVLTKIASRKNPKIDLGPIDLSCSFVVSDAQKEDMPIVYVSSTFETLTGYKSSEILGKNCRFLQAPGGKVAKGEERKFADSQVVYEMKKHIETAEECQFLNVNYKKSGEPFVNLITVIPVSLDEVTGKVTHFVGFQVDLLEQSNSILNRVSGIFFFDLS
jgi:PAS domain S-box-containing protein